MSEIRVFARLKHDWVHCLSFPLDTLNQLQFTPKPYKWIRYAIGVVIGAEGDLSLATDLPCNVVDHNLDLPTESTDLYYHVNDAEQERMFPVGPNMARTTVISNNVSTRRVEFRNDIVERDGSCVLVSSFDESNCEAAHLLPHRKGDEYIVTYTRHRSRDPTGSDIVTEIDDVRNGVLLNRIAHPKLGKSIAFLMTPNFAMNTADTDPAAPSMEKRCTAHCLIPNKSYDFGDSRLQAYESQVRMPHIATDIWPPDILFDAVYADAVLHQFGVPALQDALEQWKSNFYPGGIQSTVQADHQAIVDEQATQSKRRNKQNRECDERAAKRAKQAGNDFDYFDYFLMIPHMMKSEKSEAARKEAEEREERERTQLVDKVTNWAKNVST